MRFSFGDIVLNRWAGDRNPHRRGIFVKRKKRTIVLTDGRGEFWEVYTDGGPYFDGGEALVVVGSVVVEDAVKRLEANA